MAKIFKVGGCVRDKLLGVKCDDIDFTFVCDNSTTVDEGWEEMVGWLKDNKFEVFLEVPECFTIRARFPKEHKFEGLVADFVMARKEVGYIGGTRRPILELGTLEDDLIRRDFTINAMAEDDEGNLIDLFGGMKHLERGLLVSPQDPNLMLMDDPLRVLRALRFALTKDLKIGHKLSKAMTNPAVLVKMKEVVSQERIQSELNKMLAFDSKKTMQLLVTYDNRELKGILDIVFQNNFHLQITNKKK